MNAVEIMAIAKSGKNYIESVDFPADWSKVRVEVAVEIFTTLYDDLNNATNPKHHGSIYNRSYFERKAQELIDYMPKWSKAHFGNAVDLQPALISFDERVIAEDAEIEFASYEARVEYRQQSTIDYPLSEEIKRDGKLYRIALHNAVNS